MWKDLYRAWGSYEAGMDGSMVWGDCKKAGGLGHGVLLGI